MRESTFRLAGALLLLANASTNVLAQSAETRLANGDVLITAEKMCCRGCAQKVSAQLYSLKGVKSVGVDLSTHTVSVSLPNPSATTLGRIWQAVEQGEGRPTSLWTSTAAYTLMRPQDEQELSAIQQMGTTQHVVIENLHCQGCAQKIAAQLYAIQSVTKVRADMATETLIVDSQPNAIVSPWLMIDAVCAANERVVALRGSYGTLAIKWATAASQESSQYPPKH